jgi:hypothetical protein
MITDSISPPPTAFPPPLDSSFPGCHSVDGRQFECLSPFLIEQGITPSRNVETHFRVLFQGLMAYKRKMDEGFLKALWDWPTKPGGYRRRATLPVRNRR